MEVPYSKELDKALASLTPDGMPPAKPCCLLCVAQVQGNRKAHTRASSNSKFDLTMGLGLFIELAMAEVNTL